MAEKQITEQQCQTEQNWSVAGSFWGAVFGAAVAGPIGAGVGALAMNVLVRLVRK